MGRRWGKTLMAGSLALACANAGGWVAWIAPTYKNSRPLWRFAERMTAPVAGLCAVNKSERTVDFPGGGWLGVYSADAADSIRGEAFDLVILDEAARISQEAWQDAIQPTLSDRDGRAYLISTPKGKNWFYNEFMAAKADGRDRKDFHAPTSDNPLPNIRKAFDMARDRVPERTYRQEWLAEFIDDGGSVFRKVREAATATKQEQPVEGHRFVFGVDWGRSNDYTVITVIDVEQQALVYMDRFNQIDYVVQRGRLKALAERFKPVVILAELNSIGQPIVEQLQRDGLPVRGFTTTLATKMQIVEALALAFERGQLKILPDETLIGELQAYEQEQLASGVRYSAPEGLHDDCVVSLALAWSVGGRMNVKVAWG